MWKHNSASFIKPRMLWVRELNMDLHKTAGVIENLRITPCKQNILYAPHMAEAAGLSSIIFALAGMAGAAAQTAMNTDAGSDDVEIYRFSLNDKEYAGVTRRATFKNGEHVEIVFQEKPEGLEVLGVRRPETRSIWLYPYMSCGRNAGILRSIHLWALFGGGCIGFVAIIFLLLDIIRLGKNINFNYFFMSMFWGGAVIYLALGFVGLLFSPKLYRFSKSAEVVFKTFGFENPTMVDLHKTSKKHRKKNKIVWDSKNNLELWY
jgi:hypothetical protein